MGLNSYPAKVVNIGQDLAQMPFLLKWDNIYPAKVVNIGQDKEESGTTSSAMLQATWTLKIDINNMVEQYPKDYNRLFGWK